MANARQLNGADALLIGFMALAMPLQAQPIYRCANSYSQTPCPGAVTITVDDSRSAAQKVQSEAAIAQAVRLANDMEKTRLQQERVISKPAKAAVASTKPRPAKDSSIKPKRAQKNVEPGPFVAFTPAPEKPIVKKPESALTKP